MPLIRDLIKRLEEKDPDASYEIWVQNNPDTPAFAPDVPTDRVITEPNKIVILAVDGDTLRLN